MLIVARGKAEPRQGMGLDGCRVPFRRLVRPRPCLVATSPAKAHRKPLITRQKGWASSPKIFAPVSGPSHGHPRRKHGTDAANDTAVEEAVMPGLPGGHEAGNEAGREPLPLIQTAVSGIKCNTG